MSQPKLWDWDGMDNDFNSASGSNGAAATPAIMPATTQQMGLRPTTAAAVVSNNGGMDTDMMLGHGEKDDLDEDFDHRGMGDRPTTAGAMMYGRSNGAGGAGNGATWGYSRQQGTEGNAQVPGLMKATSAGIADYGQDGSQPNNGTRRPHTAHGARAGFPAAQQPLAPGAGNAYAGLNDPKTGMPYNEQDVSFFRNVGNGLT